MITPKDRLESIIEVIEELEECSRDCPIVVEGIRDVEALKQLGIVKNVTSLSKGISLFAFCEELSRDWDRVILLTDWDRKGGRIARRLKDAFEANGARAVEDFRARLAALTKKEVKDVESLPTYIRRLRSLTGTR
ncbi:MAG: toprim domain-containing protein [Methanobacteriota archaeon]|nr:MAG: toprim domain-containing protein [Euryarchaeota archaeon]